MDMLKLQIRVLTTQVATSRQESMREMISASPGLKDLPWSFFFAVPHEETGLQYDAATAFKTRGRTLSPAELSCFASHFAIARDFLTHGSDDYLLVFEDDLFIDPWFDVMQAAQMMNAASIDYLRLYGRALVPAHMLLYWARFQIVRFPWSPGGAQSYCLSREGAARLVSHIDRTGLISRPIDDEMDRSWQTGNAVYGLHPWPVLEKNIVTTIHSADQMATRRADQKALESALAPRNLRSLLVRTSEDIIERINRKRRERNDRKREFAGRSFVDQILRK
ncbi:MAG: glycosyltransferase family 25 protein [Mesorhizobium sp.]